MGEEIDLTRWVNALLKRWWLILACVVVCIAGGLASRMAMPDSYQATALVAIVRERTDVRIATEMRTLTEYDLRPLVNDTKRIETFEKMVPNPLVAEAVIESMGDELPPAFRNVATLTRMVSGHVADGSDAIEIAMTNGAPDLLVRLVNEWARAYVALVNDTYGGVNQDTVMAIDAKAEEAKVIYEQRQKDLVHMLETAQVDRYEQELAGQLLKMDGFTQAEAASLERVLASRERTLWLLESAKALHDQISASETVLPSSSEALTLLQAQALALDLPTTATAGGVGGNADYRADSSDAGARQFSGSTTQLHLHFGEGGNVASWSRDDALATLDSLTASLHERVLRLELEIDTLVSFGDTAAARAILELESQVRSRRSLLEEAQAEVDDAVVARDIARETYEILTRKQTELRVSTEDMGGQVRLVVPALQPKSSVPSSQRIVAISGMAGLVLGIVVALALELWAAMRQRSHDASTSAS